MIDRSLAVDADVFGSFRACAHHDATPTREEVCLSVAEPELLAHLCSAIRSGLLFLSMVTEVKTGQSVQAYLVQPWAVFGIYLNLSEQDA